MKGLFNVVIFVLLSWVMFGILGVFLIKDRLWYCNEPGLNPYGVSKTQCLEMGYRWDIRDFNFENIFSAIMTLFVLSSLEAWPTIMQYIVDSTDNETGPVEDAVKVILFYIIGFIVVGAFFFMNLFVGVIFDEFNE